MKVILTKTPYRSGMKPQKVLGAGANISERENRHSEAPPQPGGAASRSTKVDPPQSLQGTSKDERNVGKGQ